MKMIKQTLFNDWGFMRWLRLLFGIFFIVRGIQASDTLLGILGAFFLLTAVTNTACCSAGSCTTPVRKNAITEDEEITFEEIKTKSNG